MQLMRPFHGIAVAALTTSLLATGCGDDGGGTRTLDSVCAADSGLFVDFFEKALSCQEGLALFLGGIPDSSEIETACRGQFGPFLDDGTVSISQDSATWDACLAFINGIDCETFSFDGINPCADVFIGTQADGAACDDDPQCAGKAFCDDSGGTACGVCSALLADGTACMNDDECTSGLCASDSTCKTPGARGAACTDDNECAGNLICGTGGTCESAKVWAENDACDPMNFGEECGFPTSDLFCQGSSSSCKPYFAIGDTCGQGAGFCDFKKFENCENGGMSAMDKCVAGTTVAEGDDCGMLEGKECGAGLQCDSPFQGGKCIVPKKEGDACTDDCGNSIFLDCVKSVCSYGSHTGDCPAVTAAQ